MRHDEPASIVCQLEHPDGLGNTPDPTDIRLNDINTATIHQVDEFVARRQPFSGRDAN